MRKALSSCDRVVGQKRPKDLQGSNHKLFAIVQRQNMLYTVIQNVLIDYLSVQYTDIKNITMNRFEKVI